MMAVTGRWICDNVIAWSLGLTIKYSSATRGVHGDDVSFPATFSGRCCKGNVAITVAFNKQKHNAVDFKKPRARTTNPTI